MVATEASREKNVYMANLAEQAERYEEMVEFMEKVAKTVDVEELTVEERNLLSVAYKNVIGARRASWRIISSIEQKEESRGNGDHVSIIKEYRGKIEAELSKICDGILNLLESHLIPSASSAESKVFYLKMKGDYHRYLAEFKTGSERKEAAESTLLAYKSAESTLLDLRHRYLRLPEGAERHTDSGGGLYRMCTRKQMELDPGAQLLLTTCEI
ncbi:unnamed protein product [Camellia sinensis]